jgi:hypothetical protein
MWSYLEGSSGPKNRHRREREQGSDESNYLEPFDGMKSTVKSDVAWVGCSNFKTGAL